MTGIRRVLLPILCLLLLLPVGRLAAQGSPIEEPEPLPAVEAPAPAAPAAESVAPRPRRQPTPCSTAAR